MLAADKLQLQTTLKQQATALKEKEFKLHQDNLMTVGTQAAVLAGLDITMFIEFTPSQDHEFAHHLLPRILKFFYYVTIVSAFCANILVVGQTSLLSVMGASLALRGPDGSMMTATDGLYEERPSVFRAFAYGLGLTVGSVVICVWLILSPEAAFVCMMCTIFTAIKMNEKYKRVKQRFTFDESETVDFDDLFEGPGNVSLFMNAKNNVRGRNNRDRTRIGTDSTTCSNDSPRAKNRKIYARKNSPMPRIDGYSSDEYDESQAMNGGTRKRMSRRRRNEYQEHELDYDYDYEVNGNDERQGRGSLPIGHPLNVV